MTKRVWIWAIILLTFVSSVLLLMTLMSRPASSTPTGAMAGRVAPPAAVTLVVSPSALPTLPPLPATIPPPPTPRTTDPSLTPGTPPQGIPAIKPHLTVGPNQPTFTADDVRAYIAAAGIGPGKARANGPYQIESIIFMTSGEARTRLDVRSGQPDPALLCIVTIRGTFTLSGPQNPRDGSVSVVTLHTLVQIYDAVTGNLIGTDGQP